MGVRRRTWKLANGRRHGAWTVSYTERGKRHLMTFRFRARAERFAKKVQTGPNR